MITVTTETFSSDAGDLSPADWAILLKRTQLLYAFSIREKAQDVVRARIQGKRDGGNWGYRLIACSFYAAI